MFSKFQTATINTRLLVFAGMAVVLMLTLVGSNRLTSQRIDAAYRDMLDFQRSQAVIISGESGAGKSQVSHRKDDGTGIRTSFRGPSSAASAGLLIEELRETKHEALNLRFRNATGQLENTAEIGKVRQAEIPIVGDVGRVLEQMIDAWDERPAPERTEWMDRLRRWRHDHPVRYDQQPDGPIKPQYVVEELHRLTGGDATIVAGVATLRTVPCPSEGNGTSSSTG